MASRTPEHHIRLPVLRTSWTTQTFVHWAYPPHQVQALLPKGLTVDEFDGAAWVSLTPFVMSDVRLPGLPRSFPGAPTFPETNLRTYVRGPGGRDGVWFLAIEVGCPLMLAARAIGAPYHPGRLDVSPREGSVAYTGSRWAGNSSYRLVIRPGEPVTPTERDVWLTSRWRAYTRRLGAVWDTPVAHEPWPLRDGVLVELNETVTRAAELPEPRTEPLVHFSDGVRDVRMGVPRPLRTTAGPTGGIR
jgi:uncharacterized protein YqjF (DUF2071 family)